MRSHQDTASVRLGRVWRPKTWGEPAALPRVGYPRPPSSGRSLTRLRHASLRTPLFPAVPPPRPGRGSRLLLSDPTSHRNHQLKKSRTHRTNRRTDRTIRPTSHGVEPAGPSAGPVDCPLKTRPTIPTTRPTSRAIRPSSRGKSCPTCRRSSRCRRCCHTPRCRTGHASQPARRSEAPPGRRPRGTGPSPLNTCSLASLFFSREVGAVTGSRTATPDERPCIAANLCR
jgi:hypothetical protein